MTHPYDSFGIEYNRACKIHNMVSFKIFYRRKFEINHFKGKKVAFNVIIKMYFCTV